MGTTRQHAEFKDIVLTGVPLAPTAGANANGDQVATVGYVLAHAVTGGSGSSVMFNITTYGAVPNDTSATVGTANKTAINNAINAAKAVKGTVYIPNGRFFINGLLNNLTGTFNIEGEGQQSEIYCVETTPNNSDRRIINITGCVGGTFRNFKVSSDATDYHNRSGQAWGLGLINSTDCRVQGVYIEKTYAAGLMFQNCQRIDVSGNRILSTLADSIHMTNGCTDMDVSKNWTFDCGDDGVAVVSYVSNANFCERIFIHQNIVEKSWARGITVVGGKKVTIHDNIVLNSAASAILTAQDSYPTKDVFDVTISRNLVYKGGYYATAKGTTGNHYGIEISTGTDVLVSDNNVISSLNRGIQISDTKTKRVKVQGNTIRYSGGAGLWIGTVKGIEILGNTMAMNKAQGLVMIGTKDVIFNNNKIINNNFWDKDAEVTTLSASIDGAVTSLTFASGSNFTMAVPFTIVIDLEQMSVTAFNSGTGVATVTRGISSTAVSHTAGATITSGAMTVSVDNALIQSCTNVTIDGNESLEDWSVATYPDTNINNVDVVPVVKRRVERAIEFTGNTRFRVSNNLIYCNSGSTNDVYFGVPNTNADGIRDDYKGTFVPTDTSFRSGQIYCKTDTNQLYLYNGTAWFVK